MAAMEPRTELDQEFSGENATPTPWSEARDQLDAAKIYWLSTVRPDGRPHVTPLLAVWLDEALHLCAGESERKVKNLDHAPHCILTTGCNTYDRGLDLVVEGEAERVRDGARLQRIADAYEAKYGSEWRFTVRGEALHHDGGEALVFAVAPVVAFGFGRGDTPSQTRWRFSPA